MANKFKGYLLRNTAVGKIPLSFIKANSYSSTPNQQSDRNTYVDEQGLLHRDVLPHTSTKIEFETVPMNLNQKIQFQKFFLIRLCGCHNFKNRIYIKTVKLR